MATKAKRAKMKIWQALIPFSPEERLRRLRKLKGIFKDKGPKDPVAWQRRIRKDRKIIL